MANQHGHASPNAGGGEQKRSVSGKMHVQGEIEVHLPPDIQKKHAASDKKKETRENVKQWVEGVTLFFVIVVAGLTFWQARSNATMVDITAKQTKILRNQLIMDQRPYIKIDKISFADINTRDFISEPVIGQAIVAEITYSNIGKSQAVNAKFRRWITFGAGAEVEFTKRWPPSRLPSETLMQSDGGRITAVSRRDKENESSGISQQNAIPWDGSQPIILFGDVTYSDVFGGTYCTKIASRYMGKGTWLSISSADEQNPCEDHPKIEQ